MKMLTEVQGISHSSVNYKVVFVLKSLDDP